MHCSTPRRVSCKDWGTSHSRDTQWLMVPALELWLRLLERPAEVSGRGGLVGPVTARTRMESVVLCPV